MYLNFLSLFLGHISGQTLWREGPGFQLVLFIDTLQNRGQAATMVTYLCLCVLKIQLLLASKEVATELTPLVCVFSPILNPPSNSSEDLWTLEDHTYYYLCLEHFQEHSTLPCHLWDLEQIFSSCQPWPTLFFVCGYWKESTWDKGYPKLLIHLPPPPKHWAHAWHESPSPLLHRMC